MNNISVKKTMAAGPEAIGEAIYTRVFGGDGDGWPRYAEFKLHALEVVEALTRECVFLRFEYGLWSVKIMEEDGGAWCTLGRACNKDFCLAVCEAVLHATNHAHWGYVKPLKAAP